MAIQYNTSIVKNGLVLNYDAANQKASTLTNVEVLVVAGGGGGGRYGGGGGAGGVRYTREYAVTPGTSVTVTVGAGGAGHPGDAQSGGTAGAGGNSVFGTLIANGGGGGGNYSNGSPSTTTTNGASGGSGGGCGSNGPAYGVTQQSTPGAGTAGQGFAGGTQSIGYATGGGGGGGAGGPGFGGAMGGPGAAGGPGLYFSQFAAVGGSPAGWFAGGGGGGGNNGYFALLVIPGGIGGGGGGLSPGGASTSIDGIPGTGGGGGGGADNTILGTYRAGNGGSGIVIVRYPGPQRAIGGAVTRVDNHTIHTFTTVGSSTFTPLAILANGSTITGITNQVNNGFFGTPSGNPTYNNGSFVFNGSNNISVGSLGTGYNDFTVEIWFKSDSVTNYRNPIDCNWGSGNVGPRLEQNSLGNLVWVTGSSQSSYEFRTVIASGMSSTPVHCAVITKSGTTISSFYNGNLVQSAAATYTHPGYFNSVEIGRGFSTSAERWFIGNIHSVKIYNRGLTTAEVKQNFDALRGRFGI